MPITTIFTNNRTQAVRLPSEARLPEEVKKVSIRIRGKERIIAPIESSWDQFFLSGPRVSDDFMNQRGEEKTTPREDL